MPWYTESQIFQDRESVTTFSVRVCHTLDGDQILLGASHSKQPYYFEKNAPISPPDGCADIVLLKLKATRWQECVCKVQFRLWRGLIFIGITQLLDSPSESRLVDVTHAILLDIIG